MAKNEPACGLKWEISSVCLNKRTLFKKSEYNLKPKDYFLTLRRKLSCFVILSEINIMDVIMSQKQNNNNIVQLENYLKVRIYSTIEIINFIRLKCPCKLLNASSSTCLFGCLRKTSSINTHNSHSDIQIVFFYLAY